MTTQPEERKGKNSPEEKEIGYLGKRGNTAEGEMAEVRDARYVGYA
jgi:hypothetical protein